MADPGQKSVSKALEDRMIPVGHSRFFVQGLGRESWGPSREHHMAVDATVSVGHITA